MEKLKLIYGYLEKVGAQDIKIFDLRGKSSLFDYVFIATVDVARQAAALVDYINKAKKTNEIDFRNMNGEGSNWTLVDLNDILLNIFTYEERIHYNLEKLYIESPLIELDLDTPVVNKKVEVVEVEETEELEVVKEVKSVKQEAQPSNGINVQVDLNSLTIPGLKALCKQYGFKGYSTLKKAELIQLILDNFVE